MSKNSNYSDRSSKRERPFSGWQSASERRTNSGGERRWNNDRGQRRWDSDRREDRGGERRWSSDRRDERGGNRRWDGDRHSERRWNNDRGQRRWDGDRREDRGGERRWSSDRRDERGGNRRWDGDRHSERRWNNDRGQRRWDSDRREDRRWDRDGKDRGFNRDDRGGERRWSNDRRDERGGNRRRNNDRGYQRKDNRRWDNDRTCHERGGEHRGRFEAEGKDLRNLEIPESISADALDKDARRRLMSLNKENSERVARHLVYAGEMMDIDPEVSYQHALAAYQRAARIDVVREALGLTAYVTGRYSEALRELRTYRRMSDDFSHVPLEADSERGLGRPEKALRFIEGIPLNRLDPEAKVELAIVTSGARAETGDSEGGLSAVQKIIVENLDPELGARVQLTKADRLEELGREDEANEIRATWQPIFENDAEDMVLDLDDVLDDLVEEEESVDSADGFDEDGFDEEFSDDEASDFDESDDESDFDNETDEEFVAAFDELFESDKLAVNDGEEEK